MSKNIPINNRDNYVPEEKSPNRFIHPFRYIFFHLKKRERRMKLMKEFFGLLLWGAAVFVIMTVAVLAYFTKDLPSPDKLADIKMAESTKIYDRTGQVLLYEIHGDEKRTAIPFDQMPKYIKEGTISAEDTDFYKHHGLDFRAIARAALEDLRGQARKQGASTITQQLIKRSILDSQKTFTRKIKEAILSLELEQKFTKDQILEMYLNEIPYGSNSYGIEVASQTYFSKSASQLDLAECALMAAIPQAPTYFSPYGTHTEDLKRRQEWVLDRMAQLGYITSDEAQAAKEEDVLRHINPLKTDIKAPHFVMYVKDWLVNKYGEDTVQNGGFKVITTLDYQKQTWAEQAVQEWGDKNEKNYGSRNAALVSIDPKTGDIWAMVGSRDYFNTTNDGNVNVATRLRQPGSSFKPFAYATAFGKGYNPDTMLFDVKTNFKVSGKDYIPQNFNGSFNGPVSMRQALDCSLNIPAVKTLYLAGITDTINTARSMGISTLNDTGNYGLALVLGGGGVTLLEETAAYGVFANDGMKNDTSAVLRIEDPSGQVVYEKNQNTSKRAISSDIARTMNDVLSDNGARAKVFGTHSSLYIDGYNVAAKSGTTQEFRDGWTIGYTPQIVTGVWTGNNDSSPTHSGEGVYTAAPIWKSFMEKNLAVMGRESFPPPPDPKRPVVDKPMLDGKIGGGDGEEVRIDKKTGQLAEDDCPDKYTKKVKFISAHNILYYVDKSNPLGPIPKNPENDPQFKNWEDGVQGWMKDHGDGKDKGDHGDHGDVIYGDPPTEKACSEKKGKDHGSYNWDNERDYRSMGMSDNNSYDGNSDSGNF